MPRIVALGLLYIVTFFLSGCSSGNTTTVTGKITYKGAPVPDGIINFMPSGGRPIGGPIQSDGTYSYELPPGDYQVRIDAPAPLPSGFKEGDPLPPASARLVPEQYASYNSSGLTATVDDSGSQTIDFTLP